MDVELFAGLQTAHQGTLRFTVPAVSGRDVELTVEVRGPLGARAIARRIGVSPAVRGHARATQLPPPRISEFSVVSPSVRADGELALAYATTAREGEIWLLDDAGRLWGRAPMNVEGSSVLKVPQAAAGRSLRAVLHVRSAGADALASVGFTVLPSADRVRIPSAASVSKPRPAMLALSTTAAAPGQDVAVSIAGAHGDAHIALDDAAGNTIEQGVIAAGQSAVALTVPSLTRAATYYVVANLAQGVGEQTLVRTLRVTPR